MATNEVIILSMSDTNYVGSLVIRRNDLDTPNKRFKCVKKDGTPFDFTDYTPVFEVRTPAGKIIRDYNSETHKAFTSEDAEDGSFTYTFSNALFNETGEYQLAYFVFEKWDNARESILNRKSTQNFSFNVIEDAYGGSPSPTDSIAEWTQLLEQYQAWRKQLEDIVFADKERILAELDSLIIIAENNIADNEETFNIWFEQIKNSLGSDPATSLQNQMNQLLPTANIYTKSHNSFSYPAIKQVTSWEYGIGTIGLGNEPAGKFGGTNRTEIPFKVEYLDMNSYKIYVPANYSLLNPSIIELKNKNILLVDGIKSIEIEME
ncbi:BppU family phage baseplate upper protein [Listeria monocytogenes]|uniref:BppU family phage baseplate upper protein n=1 Tax=Listeria monocytogenes TaxID=1639 RepID=UPI002905C628|nr:BppU family phage baseplate upper protein [Listeria monocytogenes]EJB8834716.1 BppU family phage baseplate upper protein [Listeria monocytogenes]